MAVLIAVASDGAFRESVASVSLEAPSSDLFWRLGTSWVGFSWRDIQDIVMDSVKHGFEGLVLALGHRPSLRAIVRPHLCVLVLCGFSLSFRLVQHVLEKLLAELCS